MTPELIGFSKCISRLANPAPGSKGRVPRQDFGEALQTMSHPLEFIVHVNLLKEPRCSQSKK